MDGGQASEWETFNYNLLLKYYILCLVPHPAGHLQRTYGVHIHTEYDSNGDQLYSEMHTADWE